MAFSSRLCFAGTVTKNQGAGPFQKIIFPSNSMCISKVYQMPDGVRYDPAGTYLWTGRDNAALTELV